jgi:non-specific protein-tyrosine kinase
MKNTGIENLQLLSSGPLPPNPAELLSSQRMTQLVQRLTEIADVVIFDSPPVLAVIDAAVLAKRADGVMLVIQAGRTRRDAARQAIKRLEQVGTNILGAVLNQASRRGQNSHQYTQYYTRSGQSLIGQSSRPVQRAWWHGLPLLKNV